LGHCQLTRHPLLRSRRSVIIDGSGFRYATVGLGDGLGVRPADRVGVLMANYLEFVPVYVAIARAGAVAISFS
jgi:hypothetical protein